MCKQDYPDPLHRRLMACGFEPPIDGAIAWDHEGREPRPFEKDLPPVCPGYVCGLPEVHEAVVARQWWEKGELALLCEGEATPQLRDAISVLDAEVSACESWVIKNPPPKGS
jgi:hypothetical protein